MKTNLINYFTNIDKSNKYKKAFLKKVALYQAIHVALKHAQQYQIRFKVLLSNFIQPLPSFSEMFLQLKRGIFQEKYQYSSV